MTQLPVRAGRPAFLKKRSKKLLIILASARPDGLGQVSPKLGYFFQKRTAFCLVAVPDALRFRLPGQLPFGKASAFLWKPPQGVLRCQTGLTAWGDG
jgi:hypothetical protein